MHAHRLTHPHPYLTPKPSANPAISTSKHAWNPTTSPQLHHQHSSPSSFFPVRIGQPALWSSSLPSGSLKSLLHSKDKGILSKRKSGQVTTLTKVLQGCLKRNSTWGRAHKVLCYPTLSNLWLPGHFHLPSLLLHQGPPTTLAFLLALKHAKWGISQGFCSGDSLCPTSMLRVSPRTLTRSLPW